MERIGGESQRRQTQLRPECHWHLWAGLICDCCPQAREMAHRQWVCYPVIFKLDSISPYPSLLGFGPHMSFISICRNRETFTTMDCDRFHNLSFTVALGGRGSAYHLLIVTVPGTIRHCLSAIAFSPLRIIVSTVGINNWGFPGLEGVGWHLECTLWYVIMCQSCQC